MSYISFTDNFQISSSDKNLPFSIGISGCKWKCLVNNSMIFECKSFGQKI